MGEARGAGDAPRARPGRPEGRQARPRGAEAGEHGLGGASNSKRNARLGGSVPRHDPCPKKSRGSFQVHSDQGIRIFLENHRKLWGNGWFLKGTMTEKNGESTSRTKESLA